MSHENLSFLMEQRKNLLSKRPSIHRSRSDPMNISDTDSPSEVDNLKTDSTKLIEHEVSNEVLNQNEESTQLTTDDEREGSYVESRDDNESSLDDNSITDGIIEQTNEQSEHEEQISDAEDSPYLEQETYFNYIRESPRIELQIQKKESVVNITQIIFICLLVISVAVPWVLPWLLTSEETCDLKSIKEKFPTQEDFLWLAFESGVEDVVNMNRPSTFILLYEEDAEDTLTDLVYQLSKYAACNITDCSKEPIVISDTELNSAEVIQDYGTVIEEYRDKLKEKGVMVIKNLEKIRGKSARAFHAFCDEFTPLVDKSLFIFTMKVEELQGSNNTKFVEQYFKNKWTDIKVDTLNALITRITSMVLEVMA